MGVLDPRKVSRTALQNAASITGLTLTTDCMIAQLPEVNRPDGAEQQEQGFFHNLQSGGKQPACLAGWELAGTVGTQSERSFRAG